MRCFETIFMFFAACLSDKSVENKIVRAGTEFGDAVSYIYMGECVGFKKMLRRWTRWETEYARRGYRTISLDAFIECGGYNTPIEGLGVKRNEHETPRFHAQIYKEKFLGKVRPAKDFEEVIRTSRPQSGTYRLPSTED